MRTVAHLDNLMIGRTPTEVLSELVETIHRLQPDVVSVSGNLTASGSKRELRAARALLDALPSPQVVVPGERDNAGPMVSRWFSPPDRFARLVEANATPCFADSRLVVIGWNHAENERARLAHLVQAADRGAVKILVSSRPVAAMEAFDIILAGPEVRSEAGMSFKLLRAHPPEIILERYGWQTHSGNFGLVGRETTQLPEPRWTA